MNKNLKTFTYILVSITVIGIPITFLVDSEYAKGYQKWLKRSYKQAEKAYKSLPDNYKDEVKKLLNQGIYKTQKAAIDTLIYKGGIDKKKATKIVAVGSEVVKEIVKKVDKQLGGE